MNSAPLQREDGRTRRARQRREDTHRALLTEARAAFARGGYSQTSPEEIARAAGVSRATFYQHFDSKAEAFAAVFEDLLVRLEEAVLGVELGEDYPTPYEQLIANLLRVLDILLERHEIARLLVFEAIGREEVLSQRVEALFDHMLAMIARSLRLGHAAGLVRQVDPDIVAVAILGSIKEVLGRCLSPGDEEIPTEQRHLIARELLRYNLRGVGTAAILQDGWERDD